MLVEIHTGGFSCVLHPWIIRGDAAFVDGVRIFLSMIDISAFAAFYCDGVSYTVPCISLPVTIRNMIAVLLLPRSASTFVARPVLLPQERNKGSQIRLDAFGRNNEILNLV